MKLNFHFDIGTIFAADVLICFLFSLVLFVLGNRFRHLRGPNLIGVTFLVGGVAVIVLMFRGHMPLVLNVVLGNGLLMATNLLLYAGVARLLRIRPRLLAPAAAAVLTLCCLAYFTVSINRIDIRIVFISLCDCFMLVNLATDLLRYRERSLTVRLFAISVLLSMLVDAIRGVATMRVGAPQDLFQPSFFQTSHVVCGIFAACGLGIFSMALIAREVTLSVERDARRDPLTGALNRLGIEELVAIEIERSRRTRVPLSLAILDVDHFKIFNDTGGHASGDLVLRNIAVSIARQLRPFDACGRLGGDEFLILLPGSSGPDTEGICNRILLEVGSSPPHTTSGIVPTVSIGFTEADPTETVSDVIARADLALYAAKRNGRNCAQMELLPVSSYSMEPADEPKPSRKFRLQRPAPSMRRFRP